MARPAFVVGVLVLVVASGCLTANPSSPESTEPTTVDVPYDDRQVDPNARQNPWRTSEITVVVEDEIGASRNIAPEVMKTLRYWEHNADANASYAPEYRLRSQADDPEIRVEIVRVVDGCDIHDERVALGCAPVLDRNTVVDGTVTVQVRAGHTRAATREILKHEFGHTLGYRHGDGSSDVMNGDFSSQVPDDMLDAKARKYPWSSDELSVAVTSDDGLTATQRERVQSALEYYERGAAGTVSYPPSFELVDRPADADVVLALRENVSDCDIVGPDSSCATWDGPDVDDDSTPEYYTGARIVVESAAHDRPGWHLGYWLGYSLWTDGIPRPFQTGLAGEKAPATTWVST